MLKQNIEDEKVINLSAKMQNSPEIYSRVRFFSSLVSGSDQRIKNRLRDSHSRSHFINLTSKTRRSFYSFDSAQLANLSASRRNAFFSSSIFTIKIYSPSIVPLAVGTGMKTSEMRNNQKERRNKKIIKMLHLIMVGTK